MIVVISAAAEAELEAIGDWIAAHDPRRAVTFVRELRERCWRLIDIPKGFALVPRYEALGIRRRPFGNYSIFYRVIGDQIEVVHVLHGARDYDAILFPEH